MLNQFIFNDGDLLRKKHDNELAKSDLNISSKQQLEVELSNQNDSFEALDSDEVNDGKEHETRPQI